MAQWEEHVNNNKSCHNSRVIPQSKLRDLRPCDAVPSATTTLVATLPSNRYERLNGKYVITRWSVRFLLELWYFLLSDWVLWRAGACCTKTSMVWSMKIRVNVALKRVGLFMETRQIGKYDTSTLAHKSGWRKTSDVCSNPRAPILSVYL